VSRRGTAVRVAAVRRGIPRRARFGSQRGQEGAGVEGVLRDRLGEDHHDVALVDAEATLIAKRRIGDDAAGFAVLVELLAEVGDNLDEPIPVAIETSRGLLVACLRATGRPVFAINPMAVSRYRDRHTVARRKSDAGDALVLANIVRTDLAAHQPLPADSELGQAIAGLARAQQDAVWDGTCAHNRLRPGGVNEQVSTNRRPGRTGRGHPRAPPCRPAREGRSRRARRRLPD
jgi:hypothetical protein